MAKFGTLIVKVVKGVDIKTGQGMFGKADPYTKLKIGSQEHQTKPHVQGGKNPVWNQEFEFEGTLGHFADKSLQLAVYDHDKIGSHDHLGTTHVKLTSMITLAAW